MKEINVAKVLVSKRGEKGITQEELAGYIGVTKASVSKWETEQSYPDITLLPVLASYFNISVDELLDYQPQMSKEDIRKLYRRLSADFAVKPFDEVILECRMIIRKYYSCFPLLLQMGILMVNHGELLKEPRLWEKLMQEAKALFIRVKEESDDVSTAKKALYMEAYCNLVTGNPNGVLELLEDTVEAALPPESLLSSAYQMTGKVREAKAVLQVGIYQNVAVLFNFLPAYLMLCVNEPEKYDEVLRRALSIAETFDMTHLHPGLFINTYICAAQGYIFQKNYEKALEMLQRYADLATGDIYPLNLHGDEFFDLLDDWLDKADLGDALPRDEKTIRKSMADVIANNATLSVLADDRRFQHIVERLQSNISGN